MAALTTKYRDLRLALSFFNQLWIYDTPAVVYPAFLVVRLKLKSALWFNSMTAVMEVNCYAFTGK